MVTERSESFRPMSALDRRDGTVAAALEPLCAMMFGGAPPVTFECWDGSVVEARTPGAVAGCVRLRGPAALRRVIWAPGELGLCRAFVAGDIDLDGEAPALLRALQGDARRARLAPCELAVAVRAAARLGALGRPPAPPAEEARLRGRRHSKGRDARAISHHYDVGNDFYRLVLGDTMTYSCARWGDAATTLDAAQHAKHELVCRKLGLAARPGLRLLDVGCGWGSMAIHAATHHNAEVVGVTISEEQCTLARQRVKEAHLEDRVEIRVQDYRDLAGETFDAISSIGMFEHVGRERVAEYFRTLRALLRPTGRLLNHAISSVGGSRISTRSFMGRYVFPDSELVDVADVVAAMERAGFEVRDVESLREHYAKTLRAWIANLETNWDTAVREVGEGRARVWRLYMAGSAVGFDDGGLGIDQVLGVVTHADGTSGMPWHRNW
jgi:cyclopropane-fatty-acyl-phospholipid synthase